MSLILISGISTSGKSTVARELKTRGFEAYDLEHNGISAWYNTLTGNRVAEFGEASDKSAEWFAQHEWRVSVDIIQEFAASSGDKPVFICGGARNITDIFPYCDHIIWLRTDELTIRARVNNPRDHDYGTRPHELDRILRGNKVQEDQYSSHGAHMVDATQPLHTVVDEITTLATQ